MGMITKPARGEKVNKAHRNLVVESRTTVCGYEENEEVCPTLTSADKRGVSALIATSCEVCPAYLWHLMGTAMSPPMHPAVFPIP